MRFFILPLVLFFSCTTKEIKPSKYNFNYEVANSYKTNLIQVFDNQKNTYLHFLDLKSLNTPCVYNNNISLEYRVEKNYLILEKIYSNLKVGVGNYSSTIKNVLIEESLKKIKSTQLLEKGVFR